MNLTNHDKRVTPLRPRQGTDADDLEQLRELLLGDEYEELQQLRERFNDPASYAESVASILSEALSARSKQDNSLTAALMPNVEEAIQQSVRKDSRPLVEAIFPIIGPAIRKSIAEAFSDMLKNINDIVEQSLSVRSLKWRLEAKRTGKSYAEIALLRTLAYQVEQVFLIHKETGLLLQHVVSEKAVINDPDMVSGMLTAIRDFVADSFNVDQNESLHSLRLGELTVLIEQGPRAVVAAVVIGNPPADLGRTVKETVERVHGELGQELKEFEGDSSPFVATHGLMENCLRSQVQQEIAPSKRSGVFLWAIAVVILALLGYWGVTAYQNQQAWAQVANTFEHEPGFVLISKEVRDGVYHLNGLRDPQARLPEIVVDKAKHQNINLQWSWQPYLSMQDDFVLDRINKAVSLPERVSMGFADGVLSLVGEAPQTWIDDILMRASLIAGVSAINSDELISTDKYRLEFNRFKGQLESVVIYFAAGESAVTYEQNDKLREANAAINGLIKYSRMIPQTFNVRIVGHSDNSGSAKINTVISQERATSVLNEVFGGPYNQDIFSAEGVGAKRMNDVTHMRNADASMLRRVTFEVYVDNH